MGGVTRWPAGSPAGSEAWSLRGEPAALEDRLVGLLAAAERDGCGAFAARLLGSRDACRYAVEAAGVAGVRRPAHPAARTRPRGRWWTGRDAEVAAVDLSRSGACDLVAAWTPGLTLMVECRQADAGLILVRGAGDAATVVVREPAGASVRRLLDTLPVRAEEAPPRQVVAVGGGRSGRRIAAAAVATLAMAGVALTAAMHPWSRGPSPSAGTPGLVTAAGAAPNRVPVVSGSGVAEDPATGGVLLVGCCDTARRGAVPASATWTWDGNRWARLHPATDPPFTRGMALAFDPTIGTFILQQGGVTWVWDRVGLTWGRRERHRVEPPDGGVLVASGPVAGVRPGGHLLLLVGGRAAPDRIPATWVLSDLDAWSRLDVTTPACLAGCALATDHVHGTVVLVDPSGGAGGGGGAATYVFDGRHWVQRSAGTPLPADAHAQLTWDPGSGRVLAVVPRDSGSVRSGAGGAAQTWAWDGSSWSLANASGAPDGRGRLVTTSLGVVLFLGDAQTGGVPDVMRWDGQGWTAVPGGAPVLLGSDPVDETTVLAAHHLHVAASPPLTGALDPGAAIDVALRALPRPPPGYGRLQVPSALFGQITAAGDARVLCGCWAVEVLTTTLPACPGVDVVTSEALVLVDGVDLRVTRVINDVAGSPVTHRGCGP